MPGFPDRQLLPELRRAPQRSLRDRVAFYARVGVIQGSGVPSVKCLSGRLKGCIFAERLVRSSAGLHPAREEVTLTPHNELVQGYVFFIVLFLIIAAAIACVLFIARRVRATRAFASLSSEVLATLQSDFLEYVRVRTGDPGEKVPILPFCLEKRISVLVGLNVVEPLVSDMLIRILPDGRPHLSVSRFGGDTYSAVLTTKGWQVLEEARREKAVQVTKNTWKTTIRGNRKSTFTITQGEGNANASAGVVEGSLNVARSLRHEAEKLTAESTRDRAYGLASQLEKEAQATSPDEGKLKSFLQRTADLVEPFAGTMEATRKILETMGIVSGAP